MHFPASLDELIQNYDVLFCDVWGVLHNGIEAFPDACAILKKAREKGVTVVLVTNSPRPYKSVIEQLGGLAVPADSYDRIVTSGDVTRKLITEGPRKILHIGDDRELSLYEGLDVELVEEFEADGVVCTGLYDDNVETPEDYRELLEKLRARNLPFICANPDIVVERGEHLVWCAGALAREYGLLGGRTFIAGKPHYPIYDAALKLAEEERGQPVDKSRILAIGDGFLTDVKGAAQYGVDVLYVYGGIHAADYMAEGLLDKVALKQFIDKHGHQPVAAIERLA